MKSFLVKNKTLSTRLCSRSGGFFSAISDYVLDKKGVIYGTILQQNRKAIISRAINSTERDLMRGSKYIQSQVGESFELVKKDLNDGKIVLFTGTPCQVAGLLNFLKPKIYPNLLTADIVCHGTPSELVWNDYLNYVESQQKCKINHVDFRNKYKFGWKAHIETFYFDNGKTLDLETFKTLFFDHLIVRPSCFNCPFKKLDRPTDFTFGDAWNFGELDESEMNFFNDDNGVSLVLANSIKAEALLNSLDSNIDVCECDINHFLQPALFENYIIPRKYEEFWHIYHKRGFEKTLQKTKLWKLESSLVRKVKRYIKHENKSE